MGMKDDFTPTGLKLEGSYENDRNSEYRALYSAIIREAYKPVDGGVICGHHLVYMVEEKRPDGFTYQVVQEVPSADALIFDHDVAKKIWGADWQKNLVALALEPVETRDALLCKLYHGRGQKAAA